MADHEITWAPGDRPSEQLDRARALMYPDTQESVRYSASVTVRCQPELMALTYRAARLKGQRQSEWVRQALLTAVRLDGLELAPIPPRDAGSLYNIINGQRCYALVSGGRILVETGRLDAAPDLFDANWHPAGYAPSGGDRWVPITFEDSEPFDIERHYRDVPPVYRIEADKVVRIYQVIPRELG